MKLPKQTTDRLTREGHPEPAPAGAQDRIEDQRLRRGLETPPVAPDSECDPASGSSEPAEK